MILINSIIGYVYVYVYVVAQDLTFHEIIRKRSNHKGKMKTKEIDRSIKVSSG